MSTPLRVPRLQRPRGSMLRGRNQGPGEVRIKSSICTEARGASTFSAPQLGLSAPSPASLLGGWHPPNSGRGVTVSFHFPPPYPLGSMALNTPSCSVAGNLALLCLESLVLNFHSAHSLISFRSLLRHHLLQEDFLDQTVLGSSPPLQSLPEVRLHEGRDFTHHFPSTENTAQRSVDVGAHL